MRIIKSLSLIFSFSVGVQAAPIGPFGENGYAAAVFQALLNIVPSKANVPTKEVVGFFNAPDNVPDVWKKGHALISSLIWTSYYALNDANGMNGNITQWKFDATSIGNVPARA